MEKVEEKFYEQIFGYARKIVLQPSKIHFLLTVSSTSTQNLDFELGTKCSDTAPTETVAVKKKVEKAKAKTKKSLKRL